LTTGNTFTLDARGNLYTDLEFLPRKPIGNTDANSSVRNFMRLGANVSLVWLNQLVTPTGQEMNSFFTGPAITLSGGAKGFGGGITYSPGNGTATNVGAYTPGGGVTGSGSFKVAETPLKWRK
jgi:hypothetical protein